MEKEILWNIKQFITLDYDTLDVNTQSEVYSEMKRFLDEGASIDDFYQFLENSGLLLSGNRDPSRNNLKITEDDLNDCIANKVLEISKENPDTD